MRINKAYVCILLVLFFSSCVSTGTANKSNQKIPKAIHTDAVNIYEGIKVLSEKLISSSQGKTIGKIAVADIIGPGSEITSLGEYISEKLNNELFNSKNFNDFVERSQLEQILLTKKEEFSGYFDQDSVRKYGKLLGMDSMVIGSISDLGGVIDVTAKIIESETGRLQGIADIRIIKDSSVADMTQGQTATVGVSVSPPCDGTVFIGDSQASLKNGVAVVQGVPYGQCNVTVRPYGNDPIHRQVIIKKRFENVNIQLIEKNYNVSFQIIPPDASLSVDGQSIELNDNGYAQVEGLTVGEHNFVINAKGHKPMMETFNPSDKTNFALNLDTEDPFLKTNNKIFKIIQTAEKMKDFPIQLWTNKKDYNIGDPIVFNFRSERDCYINLVDIASNGEIRLIFPNRFHPDNKIQGGRTYTIPDSSYGFQFEIEPPSGAERVYAIASTSPLNIFDYNFNRDAFYTMERGKTRSIKVMGIGVKLNETKLNSAAQCVIKIH